MTLSSAITLGQSGPVSNSKEQIFRFRQSSSITGASPSVCLVSCPGHSLVEESYPFEEMQSVYSTAPADWAEKKWRVWYKQ